MFNVFVFFNAANDKEMVGKLLILLLKWQSNIIIDIHHLLPCVKISDKTSFKIYSVTENSVQYTYEFTLDFPLAEF